MLCVEETKTWGLRYSRNLSHIVYAQDAEAALDVDVLAGLRPHNLADMRAFLNLSGFLTELLPLLGPELFKR